MSCTLEELQNTEYEILCKFADFCEKYDIKYVLNAGTLIGAVRHNGFIPWDDDVDVMMDAENFMKLKRIIKKHPIEGYHFSWFDIKGEEDYPLPFAKLRKNDTYMPEPQYEKLRMKKGIWIDIFIYYGKPENAKINSFQENLLRLFNILNRRKLNNIISEENKTDFDYSKKYKFFLKQPYFLIRFLKKIIFLMLYITDNKKSEFVMASWYLTPTTIHVKRKFYEPSVKHVFVDREFSIPKNYDELLRTKYGDYMTPVKYENHTDFKDVIL